MDEDELYDHLQHMSAHTRGRKDAQAAQAAIKLIRKQKECISELEAILADFVEIVDVARTALGEKKDEQ